MGIKNWIDRRLASYVSGLMGFADVTVIREPRIANAPKKGWHYVVINMEKFADRTEGHLVLPGEEPQTFPTLDEAMTEVVRLSTGFDHNVESARIFQLVQMDLRDMHALFDEKIEEYFKDE